MKVFLVLTVCVLMATGSNAFLGKVAEFFKEFGHDFVEGAKPIGENLLHSLENTGKGLLSQTIQDLLLHLGNLGKRDASVIEKVENFAKGVGALISHKTSEFKELFNAAVTKLAGFENKIKSLEFLGEPIEKLVSEIEATVAGHNAIADHFLANIVNEAHQLLTPLVQLGSPKRGILDSLGLNINQIGASLASLFKPHIDALKTLVSSAGNTLKGHATNLLNAVKGSVLQLGTKLKTHVDTLKTHLGTITSTAAEALATLKDAIGQVLKDTFSSLHAPITGIVNTLTNAAGTVVNHVSSNINPKHS